MRWLFTALFFSLVAFGASAQESPNDKVAPEEAGGAFTIGKITVDKQAGTVRFPAKVNMVEGTVEYLLVTDKGKTHESLFTTTVSPFQLHIAMLLLGVKPVREIAEMPPEYMNAAFLKGAPQLQGDKIDVLVSWKKAAEVQHLRAEEWLNNHRAPMATGPWVYTGSALYQKRFLAQEDGSIVALVTDPAALVNNPRPGHDDNTIWSVRNDQVPPVGTPVEITFQILTPKK